MTADSNDPHGAERCPVSDRALCAAEMEDYYKAKAQANHAEASRSGGRGKRKTVGSVDPTVSGNWYDLAGKDWKVSGQAVKRAATVLKTREHFADLYDAVKVTRTASLSAAHTLALGFERGDASINEIREALATKGSAAKMANDLRRRWREDKPAPKAKADKSTKAKATTPAATTPAATTPSADSAHVAELKARVAELEAQLAAAREEPVVEANDDRGPNKRKRARALLHKIREDRRSLSAREAIEAAVSLLAEVHKGPEREEAQAMLRARLPAQRPEVASTPAVNPSELEALRAEVDGLRQWSASVTARAEASDERGVSKAMHLIALASSSNENEARNAAHLACRMIRERGLLVATSVQQKSNSFDLITDEELEAQRRSNAERWERIVRRVEAMERGL